MGDRRSLTAKIIEGMTEAVAKHDDPWDYAGEEKVRALAAQRVAAAQITAVSDALTRACVRLKHRGSVPARGNSPILPCARCKVKIKHYTEAADMVAPD